MLALCSLHATSQCLFLRTTQNPWQASDPQLFKLRSQQTAPLDSAAGEQQGDALTFGIQHLRDVQELLRHVKGCIQVCERIVLKEKRAK